MIIIERTATESYYTRPSIEDLKRLPASLRGSPQWLCWKELAVSDSKKPKKVPVNPETLQGIDPHAPESWMTFEAALAAYENTPELAGIGFDFAPGNPFAGVDIDKCRNPETGEIEPWAWELARRLDSYTEVSPSLTGIKIFMRADLAGRRCHFELAGREIEVYSRRRYFTLTGEHVEDTPYAINDRQKMLFSLLPSEPETPAWTPPADRDIDAINKAVDAITDAALINSIKNSKQGAKFSRLIDGYTTGYPGRWAAAGALCVILAAWTRLDPARIDRIVRASAAVEAWDLDWWDGRYSRAGSRGEVTIAKACALAASRWQYDPTEEPQLAALIEEFNDRFYVVEDYGGKCRVCWEDQDASFKLDKPLLNHQSFEDFRNRFMHLLIKVGEKKKYDPETEEESTVPIYESKGKAWLTHRSRRQYREVVFAPNREVEPELRNLWQGFGYEPKKGDCSKYLAHVKDNICQGNDEHYDWLIRWMAYAVRNPAEQGHVALVLRGLKGVGKNVFAEGFDELWGRHGIVLSNEKHVTSNFNAHFLGKCSLVADEAFFAGDPKQARLLKGLITGNTIAIESKGVNTIVVPNFLHVIIIGNDNWLVSASGDERRFFALDCGDGRREDHDYFRLIDEELKNGGYSALLWHLLYEVDLNGFDVRSAPHTDTLHDQMVESQEGASRLWLDSLMTGELPGQEPNDAFEPAILKDDGTVHLHLGRYLDHMLKRHPRLASRVSEQHLYGLFGTKEKNAMRFRRKTRHGNDEERRWEIPTLAECRRLWEEKRFPVPWPETEPKNPPNSDADDSPDFTRKDPSSENWTIPPPVRRR